MYGGEKEQQQMNRTEETSINAVLQAKQINLRNAFWPGSFKSTLQPLREEGLPLAQLQLLIITKLRETPSTILWLITLPMLILYCISNEERFIRLNCSGILSTFEIFLSLKDHSKQSGTKRFSAFPRRWKEVFVPMKLSLFFFSLKSQS